jgi:hypothetical protein
MARFLVACQSRRRLGRRLLVDPSRRRQSRCGVTARRGSCAVCDLRIVRLQRRQRSIPRRSRAGDPRKPRPRPVIAATPAALSRVRPPRATPAAGPNCYSGRSRPAGCKPDNTVSRRKVQTTAGSLCISRSSRVDLRQIPRRNSAWNRRRNAGQSRYPRTPLASVPCLISDANSTQSRPRQGSRA